MKTIRGIAETLLYIAIAVAICFGFALALPESKYGLSAWVQAIGSILAILAAFVVAERQFKNLSRLDAERAIAERVRKVDILRAILINLAGLASDVNDFNQADNSGDLARFDAGALKQYIVWLEAIPVFEVPSASIVYLLSDLPGKINQLIGSLHAGHGSNLTDYGVLVSMRQAGLEENSAAVFKMAVDAIAECSASIDAMQRAADGRREV